MYQKRRRNTLVLVLVAGAVVVAACTVPPPPPPPPDTTTTTSTETSLDTTTTTSPSTTTTTAPPPPPELAPQTLLGGARNFLGTGNQIMRSGYYVDNYWLSVSGPCASKENGDRISTISDANFSSTAGNGGGTWSACVGANTVTNPEYRPDGYFYGIRLPSEGTGPFGVQIFDPGYCTSGSTKDNGGGTFTTSFTLRRDDGPEPGDGSIVAGPITSATCNGWFNFASIDGPPGSTYFVQVQTSGTSADRDGMNSFAIRVTNGTGFTWDTAGSACSADPTDVVLFSASCPVVFGYDYLGLFANNPSGRVAAQAAFNVAMTDTSNSGEQLQIELWDPGEGARALQVLDPAGFPVPFTWEAPCWSPTESIDACSDVPPLGGRGPATSGTVSVAYVGTLSNAIDLWGNGTNCQPGNPQPGNFGGSCSKYNDRIVRITVELPGDIAAAYGGATWWKVRYTTDGPYAPTDRTTWSATVVP
ncbi:MAG: hypothetical protein HYX32_08300 [Actinobacteria bacterium]|nr:hypothetical protein [Actinomycetota bacterium]